ncbi:MAG: alanine racemase, partial [Clostridia bacterium]|nr:alanine racemase [Clostridia bacterium]
TLRAVLAIAADPRLRPVGVFSHLASADCPGDAATALAVSRFRAAVRALSRRGLTLPAHLAASAAVLGDVGAGLPLARLGLALYGYPPTGAPAGLLPVARLVTDIASVFSVARGEAVGYGGGFRAARREVIGILPIGYADGLLRSAEGGLVCVAGRLCPLVGRISMDAAAVLLTGIPRRAATAATVFGADPADLYRLAEAAGTIPYELLAGLGARIDRKYSYGKDPGTCHTE